MGEVGVGWLEVGCRGLAGTVTGRENGDEGKSAGKFRLNGGEPGSAQRKKKKGKPGRFGGFRSQTAQNAAFS